MSNAKIFISQIKNGDVTDAIKTIKESLGLQLSEGIKTTRLEILSTYGFSEKFEKEEDKSKDDGEDKDKEDKKEDDSDEGKKDKEEDKSEEEGK